MRGAYGDVQQCLDPFELGVMTSHAEALVVVAQKLGKNQQQAEGVAVQPENGFGNVALLGLFSHFRHGVARESETLPAL